MAKVNIISAFVLLFIAGYVMWVTRSYPPQKMTLGPAFFPKLVSGFLAAFSLGILLMAFLKGGKEENPSTPRRALIMALVCLGIYIFALPWIGFLFSTPPFLIASGFFLADDPRKCWKAMAISAVPITGGLYCLFVVLLKVPLP